MKLSNFGECLGPKVEVMVTTVTKSSIDQISTDENEGNIVTSQDNQESYRGINPNRIGLVLWCLFYLSMWLPV